MTSPYARLRMLVTPNWTVNPTAASAITAAVTIPKPIACTNMRWLPPGWGPGRLLAQRCDVGGRDNVHQGGAPVRLVARDLEAAGRVVPLVPGDEPGGADVIDLLARVERREAGRVRMHHHAP